MADGPQFPSPEATDPEDVAWALETASAMWGRGDREEAVKWLRRAAESAADAGNDLRAVGLARAAADLSSAAPAEAPVQLAPAIMPVDDASVVDHTVPDASALPPESQRPPPRSVPPPPGRRPLPPRVSPVPLGSSTQASPPPRSAARQAPPRSRPPASRPTGSVPRNAPPPLSAPKSAPPPLSAPKSTPPPLSAPKSAPPPRSERPPALTDRPSAVGVPASVRPRQSLRVSVELAPDDESLLVRPLAEGEAAPPGAHEAILTALEPGASLMQRKP